MTIYFTIAGNHENPRGNPVPYVRSTRGALWREDGKRYAAWKSWVQKHYLAHLTTRAEHTAADIANVAILHHDKPIVILNNQKPRMDLKIFWANGAHGDPDNIWKGIADALFVNDKNLDGSFQSQRAQDGRGRVEVEITIT